MVWLNSLLWGNSVAHVIFVLASVIALGILLNKIKIAGVQLGITWILFVGILLSHFGLRIDAPQAEFIKEFGLVLFVYSIGLQVGPGFFASFKKGGMKLNLFAVLVIVLGCIVTVILTILAKEDSAAMVGVLTGAVTNTPSLGAAQQTYQEMHGTAGDAIAMGYAVAYPLGIVGLILVMILLRVIFRIDLKQEAHSDTDTDNAIERINVKITNHAIVGKCLADLKQALKINFVIARVMDEKGEVSVADVKTIAREGDVLRIICRPDDESLLFDFFGERVHIDASVWETPVHNLVSRRVLLSKSELNGERIGDLSIRRLYGVNITRITRAGVDLIPTMDIRLQIGDRLTLVGREEDVAKVTDILGNSLKKLDIPNLLPIFLGIVLGVLIGSIPIAIPGMPMPVKLGLAGGPLIVAILIGYYGPKSKLVTFTTTSANLMIRELGICMFLAAVGLTAGENFVPTIMQGGYMWIIWGFLITVIPTMLMAVIARLVWKFDYFTILGALSGCQTNPAALSYANSLSGSERTSVAYATVYPVSMFLRILAAEVLIMIML
ncbi:MAG: putative transporter [Bacteroidales bacterium]|nr:putative transporter [Bacteroidales bacterium]